MQAYDEVRLQEGKMKLVIAADHGGFKLKEELKEYLDELAQEYADLGTDSEDSVDYPDYAKKVAKEVQKGALGILICGTGIGMSMTANKFKGVRAALCYDEYTARMSREHNDANVLCMGGRVVDSEMAKKITKVWLETPFSKEERHHRRVGKISC